ncbi:hypothetical protein [Nitrosovibrio tenuis]|uniref:Lipoprotein n=1 Tax=Nitrosovibrio tenuis TaxID=1233 RepID=A0A1H7II78_9PROT|nr:hypothetical protein [Nitrosovibrio tenuis]SEK60395.1 hypothetical protein SAMN05216387_102133 [Nitrosovibrio tenuis]
MVINKTIIAIAVAVCLTAGCTASPKRPGSDEMYIKASALTKLSAAVESTVRYKNPPPDLSDSELLALATRHDPILLENFKNYKVKVQRQDRHSVVLICDATGTHALLEDAGCTGPMDRARWIGKPEPCDFSINVGKICGN